MLHAFCPGKLCHSVPASQKYTSTCKKEILKLNLVSEPVNLHVKFMNPKIMLEQIGPHSRASPINVSEGPSSRIVARLLSRTLSK